MDRVNQILVHPLYQECVEKICKLEKDRIFCRHNMVHFLDVARLAYVLDLEEQLTIPKERIYATALLHDIGRHIQYEQGIPHSKAGVPIAEKILKDCGFEETERTEMLTAIARHGDKTAAAEKNLNGLIYRADKLSRSCFACPVEKECDWIAKKKNLQIKY